MRLTPFGKKVRVARMDNSITLKEMAEALGISSPLLSSIELGERRLASDIIEKTISFLRSKGINDSELKEIQMAGDQSMSQIEVESLNPSDRGFIAAFARKIGQGEAIPPQLFDWINDK